MYKNIATISLITVLVVSNAYIYFLYQETAKAPIVAFSTTTPVTVSSISTSTISSPESVVKSESVAKISTSTAPIQDIIGKKYFEPHHPEYLHYSNVMFGYFAGGAFFINFPRWVNGNWSSEAYGKHGVRLVPQEIDQNQRDFSDIIIDISPSSEIHNADTLYTQDLKVKDYILSEIILNESENGRIYHIQKILGGHVHDTYYIDGDKYTAVVTFSAKIGDQAAFYGARVKDLVRGISPWKVPQG